METRYSSKELVHTNKGTGLQVYKATLSTGHTLCVKEQRVKGSSSLLQSLRTQQQLRHRNVCEVLRVQAWEEDGQTVVRGELPWLFPSLDYHTLCLRKARQSWSLSHAFLLLDHLSSALSLSQSLHLPHHCLCPSNIYMQPGPLFLLSNFKADTSPTDQKVEIAFLSPLLRQEYAQRIMGNAGKVSHNEYKTDVFALGVVVLSMSQWEGVGKANGNLDRLYELLDACSYSVAVKSLLREMLAAEETERPDCIALRTKVRNLIEASLLQPVHFAMEGNCSAALEPLSQLLLCSVSLRPHIHTPVASPQVTKCVKCGEVFSVNLSEPWRLSLWGSCFAKPSKSICSEACLSLHIDIDESRPSSHSQGPEEIENSIVSIRHLGDCSSLRLYYDCQVHTCKPSHIQKYCKTVRPGLLSPCPECPAPTLRTGSFAGYTVYISEVYQDSFAFVQLSMKRDKVIGKLLQLHYEGSQLWACPWPLLLQVSKGNCHLCEAKMQMDWRPFLHAQQTYIVCSQRCALTHLTPSSTHCPVCRVTITAARRDLARGKAKGLEAFFASADSESCCLCLAAHNDISLDCEHHFCEQCIHTLLRVKPGKEIPCLYCGTGSGLVAS